MAKNNGVAVASRGNKSRIGAAVAKAAKKVVKKTIGANKPAAGGKGVKRVYFFGNGKAEGNANMKDLLGGKGANLADMTLVPLPVPPGFTITTETCGDYNDAGQKLPARADGRGPGEHRQGREGHRQEVRRPEEPAARRRPLGAKFSMPGMMDTVLNIGLNDEVVEGLAELTSNERFAYDSYRRLINMFGDTVMGVDHHHFEHELSASEEAQAASSSTPTSTPTASRKSSSATRRSTASTSARTSRRTRYEQLEAAIEAVFKSWMGDRAIRYRELNDIRGVRGTAVNVQAMVFGNMGDDSATGVAFTRNPSHRRERVLRRVPRQRPGRRRRRRHPHAARLQDRDGQVEHRRAGRSCSTIKNVLEKRYKDVQDFEFTIEKGKLYMLQTRNGKRTAQAAVKIAVDMVKEKLIDEKTAILRVDPASLDQLLHPTFDPKAERRRASPRACPPRPARPSASSRSPPRKPRSASHAGEKIILVRRETEPADIGGMHVSEGILTSTGGMTSTRPSSPAAWARPASPAPATCTSTPKNRKLTVNGKTYGPDDFLSLDGGTGEVMEGQVADARSRR